MFHWHVRSQFDGNKTNLPVMVCRIIDPDWLQIDWKSYIDNYQWQTTRYSAGFLPRWWFSMRLRHSPVLRTRPFARSRCHLHRSQFSTRPSRFSKHRTRGLPREFRFERSSVGFEMDPEKYQSLWWRSEKVFLWKKKEKYFYLLVKFTTIVLCSVTVFGESAGGASATYLMMSPLAKGIIARCDTYTILWLIYWLLSCLWFPSICTMQKFILKWILFFNWFLKWISNSTTVLETISILWILLLFFFQVYSQRQLHSREQTWPLGHSQHIKALHRPVLRN